MLVTALSKPWREARNPSWAEPLDAPASSKDRLGTRNGEDAALGCPQQNAGASNASGKLQLPLRRSLTRAAVLPHARSREGSGQRRTSWVPLAVRVLQLRGTALKTALIP